MQFSTTRRLFAVLLAVSLLALPACDSDGNEDPAIEGQWSGTANVDGSTVTLDATFNDSGGEVSGNGTLDLAGESYSTEVSGTYSYPNVSLTFATGEFAILNFSGDMSEDGQRIDGQLNGSEISDVDITLTRD